MRPLDERTYIDDLKDYLILREVAGPAMGWPIYTYSQPAPNERGPQDTIPARAVTLYPTAGRPPPGRPGMLYSGLMLRLRAERGGDGAAATRCSAIVNILHRISDQDVGATNIRWIERDQSEPFPLGPDDGGRPEFSFNLTVVRGG